KCALDGHSRIRPAELWTRIGIAFGGFDPFPGQRRIVLLDCRYRHAAIQKSSNSVNLDPAAPDNRLAVGAKLDLLRKLAELRGSLLDFLDQVTDLYAQTAKTDLSVLL